MKISLKRRRRSRKLWKLADHVQLEAPATWKPIGPTIARAGVHSLMLEPALEPLTFVAVLYEAPFEETCVSLEETLRAAVEDDPKGSVKKETLSLAGLAALRFESVFRCAGEKSLEVHVVVGRGRATLQLTLTGPYATVRARGATLRAILASVEWLPAPDRFRDA